MPQIIVAVILHALVTYGLYYKLQEEKSAFAKYRTIQETLAKTYAESAMHIQKQKEKDLKATADKLAEERKQYESRISDINSNYSSRMLDMEKRLQYYSSLSASTEVGDTCRNLATRAAGLDRSLEEGRQLVGELKEAVILRDKQLRETVNTLGVR